MGCGKTTVGRLLARQLAWRFVDIDERVEERTGVHIMEIFERMGEPAFREIEHELLEEALVRAAAHNEPTVIALGGGTFVQPQNIEIIRAAGAPVIWLECPVDVLLSRCATLTNRPLFRDEGSFRKLYEQRLPFYEQADYRVRSDTDPLQAVEQVLALDFFQGAKV